MQNKVRILLIGDIIGKGGRNAFTNSLLLLKEKYNFDILSVNGENTTHGKGLSLKHYKFFKNLGVDVITMGNHTFDNEQIYDYIKNVNDITIPLNINYTSNAFDNHYFVDVDYKGYTIRFINMLGMYGAKLDVISPYDAFDKIYDPNIIYVVDFHAELTMEKNGLGYYLDGKASVVFGTHTHVQTADERILPLGTAYISDVGMCGSYHSVIGYDYKSYIDHIKKCGRSFVSETGPLMVNGLIVDIDLESKKAIYVERVNIKN